LSTPNSVNPKNGENFYTIDAESYCKTLLVGGLLVENFLLEN